jgi:hypothetical protein
LESEGARRWGEEGEMKKKKAKVRWWCLTGSDLGAATQEEEER